MGCPVHLGNLTIGAGIASERIALEPDASLIYGLNQGGNEIRRYTYPALSYQAQEYTTSDLLERQALAIDDSGVLFWVEYNAGSDTSSIRKDTSSPTTLHSSTNRLNDWTICWSPYDGLLYVLDAQVSELITVDPSTGTPTTVATGINIRGNGASQTQPVPTLDGGIWWERSGTNGPIRYDIPADTTATTTSDGTPKQSMLPRPNNDAWTHTSACTYAAGSITKAAHGCSVPGSILSVGYTPTLDRVAYLSNVTTGDVYELTDDVVNPWTVGRVSWGSRGAWH